MKPETLRTLNLIQLISEIAIAVGYLIGIIPFAYAWSSGWVIPLVFVSLILAVLTRNGTLLFTIGNVLLAVLSYIPLIGFVFRIIGVGISWINFRMIRRGTNSY
jgi:predicted branched-subunit amino acid permease